MVHDVVRFAQIKYYEEEIGRLLVKRNELLAKEDEAHEALAKIVGERIMELLGKLEELK
jgi:hypothetical protein